ncbi:MAG TPA: hypothetical protein PKB14_23685 [Rubrivivax sp.]|nr:hypothetical protein [Rubrivivax sp.]
MYLLRHIRQQAPLISGLSQPPLPTSIPYRADQVGSLLRPRMKARRADFRVVTTAQPEEPDISRRTRCKRCPWRGLEGRRRRRVDSSKVTARPIAPDEDERYQQLLEQHHQLGAIPKIGQAPRHVAPHAGAWAALLSIPASLLKCGAGGCGSCGGCGRHPGCAAGRGPAPCNALRMLSMQGPACSMPQCSMV